MEKRFQILDEKTMECTVLVVLTDSEVDILECPDLRSQIDNIAKELHVRWAIEINGNVTHAAISKVLGPIGTSHEAHALEIKATNFMSAVDKLTLPAFNEANCPTHEPANEEAEVLAKELEFVKSLKEGFGDMRGALIMPHRVPEPIAFLTDNYCTVSPTCLRRMIDAYLKEYDHE